MSSSNSGKTHTELTNNLIKNHHLFTPELIAAWRKCDRKYFNPLHDRKGINIYEDRPFPIGADATISAPHVHTVGIQTVSDNLFSTEPDPITGKQVIPKRTILDVASGSGYMTGLFGTVCKDSLKNGSTVLGIDIHQSLVDQSIQNINNYDSSLIKSGTVKVEKGDAFRPAKPFIGSPFDVIHAGCAIQFVPCALMAQLKPGGSMIVPIQVNPRTNTQKFYHITRKSINYKDIDYKNLSFSMGKKKTIDNDDDFFKVASQIQNDKDTKGASEFMDTFFTYKSLFACAYLLALDDTNAPQDVKAWNVKQ